MVPTFPGDFFSGFWQWFVSYLTESLVKCAFLCISMLKITLPPGGLDVLSNYLEHRRHRNSPGSGFILLSVLSLVSNIYTFVVKMYKNQPWGSDNHEEDCIQCLKILFSSTCLPRCKIRSGKLSPKVHIWVQFSAAAVPFYTFASLDLGWRLILQSFYTEAGIISPLLPPYRCLCLFL